MRTPMTAPTVDTPLTADDERAMCQKHEPLTKAERNHIIAEMDRWGDLWLIQRYEETVLALESALLAARREVEAMRSAATECADDLEAEIRNRYHYPDIHPAMQGKYERDIEPVLAVRAALAATPEEK